MSQQAPQGAKGMTVIVSQLMVDDEGKEFAVPVTLHVDITDVTPEELQTQLEQLPCALQVMKLMP